MTTGDWSGLLPGVLIVGGGYILFLLTRIFKMVSEMSEWQRARHEEVIEFLETMAANAERTAADDPPHS